MTLATIHGRKLALRVLDANRLRDLVDAAKLTVADRRSRDLLIGALADARRVDLASVMGLLSRDELKAMCRALDLPDDGRDKSPIVERLLGGPGDAAGPEAEDPAPVRSTKPWRTQIIDLMKRDELAEVIDRLELPVGDRRVHQNLRDAVDRSETPLSVVLENLPRVRLKELCRTLGLDDSGKEKAPIVLRLADGPTEEGEDADGTEAGGPFSSSYGPEVIASLVPGMTIDEPATYWPAQATINLNGQTIPVDIHVRVIGGTGRSPTERRFQNPASGAPISPTRGRPCLLLGVWLEQGRERAVLVAFDAYKRRDKSTRFSLFMPLAVLEEAADVGFVSHVSHSDETIYAFRPDALGRYLDAFAKGETWGDLDPGTWARPALWTRAPTIPPLAPPKATHNVEIRPKSGMYAAFARLNYKPWFALAELVDNAVQSFIANRDRIVKVGGQGPLVVDIHLDTDELSVTDRAAGIRLEDFDRAFSPATPPTDPSGLSEFGLGMKAAACWFANEWSVRTSALGEEVEREITFDVPKIAQEGLDALPIQSQPSPAEAHYTVITMRKLRVVPKGSTLTKIKDHLASIYRLLIEDGTVRIRLTVNGKTEELAYEQPKLLVAPFYATPDAEPVLWRRDIRIEISPQRIVTGWAGIMETGKYARAGFSVFRRRRLIEGSVGEAYRPRAVFGAHNSFSSQRIVGELYVEGFDVTHTKDGIQWGDDEDDVAYEIRTLLEDDALPIRDQAEGYRAKKSASLLPPSFGHEGFDVAIGTKNGGTIHVDPPAPEPPPDEEPASTIAPNPTAQQHRTFTVQSGEDKEWSVRVELVRDPPAPWLDVSTAVNDEGEHLHVRINLSHPFSEQHLNDNERAMAPIIRLAVALAIGEVQAKDQGVKFVGTTRKNANKILKNTHLMVPTSGETSE